MKNWKKLSNRVLSLVVALVMCVGMIPGSALAAGEGLAEGHTGKPDCPKCTTDKYDWNHDTHVYDWKTYCKCCGKTYEAGTAGYTGVPICQYNNNGNHRMEVIEPAKEATCSEPGRTEERVCTFCYKVRVGGDETPVTNDHIPSDTWTTSATEHWKTCANPKADGTLCGEEIENTRGNHTYSALTGKCTVCEAECAHVYDDTYVHDNAENAQEGEHWQVCKICGQPTEHAPHQVAYEVTPVEKDGWKTWSCKCGFLIQREPIHQHDFTSGEYKYVPAEIGEDQTVIKRAGHTQKCKTCDEYGAWEQHSPECMEWVTTDEPTCAVPGKTEYKCKLCGGVGGYGSINTVDHTWGEKYAQKGTTQHGHQCSVCGEWKDVEDHKVTKWDKYGNFEKGNCDVCGILLTRPAETGTETPEPTECQHTNTTSYKKVPATCENPGKESYYECNDCGKLFKGTNPNPVNEADLVIKKLGHDLERHEQVDATCTSTGMESHEECTRCGKLFKGTNPTPVSKDNLVIAKLGHDLERHDKVDATCTSTGMESHEECARCGKFFKGTNPNPVTKDNLVIKKLGHDWKHNDKVEPSCTDKGMESYDECSRCGKLIKGTNEIDSTAGLVIEKLDHTPETVPGFPATCKDPGKTDGTKCSVCGETLEAQTDIPKTTNHTWVEGVVTNPPTCQNASVRKDTCSVCGEERTVDLAANPANHSNVVTDAEIPATCEEAGRTAGSHCKDCGATISGRQPIEALGHNMVADAARAATCTTTGLTAGSHCDRDGCDYAVAQTTIPALGHTSVADAAVAATCTTTGLTAGAHCGRCNTVLTAQTTIPATGHAWNAGVITTYPTYYSTGLRTYTCTTCGGTRTETIPALTYTYDPDPEPDPEPDPDPVTPPTNNRQPNTNTNIPDIDTPLANGPVVNIEDEDTPLAARPLPFIDVNSDDWFRSSVAYVFGKGMMTGMTDELFGPSVSTTRGMIVTIIYRMENATATGVSPFTDVEADEYYADPIAWASDNGVVLGYSETLFGPKDNITREQMAAILYRYCQAKGIDTANYGDLSRFPDADQVSGYAVEAMRWAVDRGLIAGLDDGRLDPTGTATRAQVATILNRFCEMIGA